MWGSLLVRSNGRDNTLSLGKPGRSQGFPHLLAIGRWEAPHGVVGVRLADGEPGTQFQNGRYVCLGFVSPVKERQRIGHLEMAEPELLNKGLAKRIQCRLIPAAKPVVFCGRPPPPARRA